MRILFVTQVVLDRPHGGPRHVLSVARSWARSGHEVHLLAPGTDPEEEEDGVRRVRPPWSTPGARLEFIQAGLVARELRRVRPEVAYVRLSATSSAVPVALASLGVPFVTELNGRILDELRLLGRSEAAVQAVAWAQRQIAHRAFATVAVEAKIGRHASALGARDVRVIENGADIERATPGDRTEARRQLGLPVGRPVFAFAGTLVPELRLDLLLAALEDVPDALLVVAGDGPARSELEKRVAQSRVEVRWLGARPHAEAVALLRAANVCVNVRDGDMGMKALEYAAVARRFVAFRVEGSERLEGLYPDHPVAFLVENRTAGALRESLLAALEADRSVPIPELAVRRARAAVSWDRTAIRLAEVLLEASGSKSSA